LDLRGNNLPLTNNLAYLSSTWVVYGMTEKY